MCASCNHGIFILLTAIDHILIDHTVLNVNLYTCFSSMHTGFILSKMMIFKSWMFAWVHVHATQSVCFLPMHSVSPLSLSLSSHHFYPYFSYPPHVTFFFLAMSVIQDGGHTDFYQQVHWQLQYCLFLYSHCCTMQAMGGARKSRKSIIIVSDCFYIMSQLSINLLKNW